MRLSPFIAMLLLAGCSTSGGNVYEPVACRLDNPCVALNKRACDCCPGGPEACVHALEEACADGELVLTPAVDCMAALEEPLDCGTKDTLLLICPPPAPGTVVDTSVGEPDTAADAGPDTAADAGADTAVADP